jgi:hypothetical protein
VSDMVNPSGASPVLSLLEQTRQKLNELFQNKYVKNLVDVFVPSTLAAILLPVFGPVVAGSAAAVAVKNGLAMLNISMKTETIEKLLKPFEGKKLEDTDIQDVLKDTLEHLLPTDRQVNEDAAKALVTVIPTVKEAALTNPKLSATWLSESFESNLKEQGGTMEKIAPTMRELLLKNGELLEAERQYLLQNWQRVTVEVTATNKSRVSDVESKAKAAGGTIDHRVAADNESTIEGIKMDSEID